MMNGNGTGNNCPELLLNRNKYKNSIINGITGNNPEILKRNGNSGQNPGNFFIYTTYVRHIHDAAYMDVA